MELELGLEFGLGLGLESLLGSGLPRDRARVRSARVSVSDLGWSELGRGATSLHARHHQLDR